MKILLAIVLGAFFEYDLYKIGATSPKKLLSMLRLLYYKSFDVMFLGQESNNLLSILKSFSLGKFKSQK